MNGIFVTQAGELFAPLRRYRRFLQSIKKRIEGFFLLNKRRDSSRFLSVRRASVYLEQTKTVNALVKTCFFLLHRQNRFLYTL